MYTLTCSVEVVEGLAFPPIVTWMNADSMIVTENVMEQETDGTITTRDLVFSSLSVADLGVYVCEGCVTISKVFINDIDRHCGLTMPCVATESKYQLILSVCMCTSECTIAKRKFIFQTFGNVVSAMWCLFICSPQIGIYSILKLRCVTMQFCR